MNHPYLVLDSSGSGSKTNEQSAQISLGESGRGGASLHLAYTGNGYSYIGMGSLGSDNIPDYYAMRMYYQDRNVYFPGSIGIGTKPSQTLDVNGTIQTNSQVNSGHHLNVKALNSTEGGHIALSYGGNTSFGESASTWNIDVVNRNLRFFRNNAAGKTSVLMQISENGPVQINGTLKADRLELPGGPDYPDFVFSEDYRLRSLEEVEAHIRQHRRLPEIPSAAEVNANGLSVSDMLTKQLQKIEELTLYMIELKKENKRLKKRMAALEKK